VTKFWSTIPRSLKSTRLNGLIKEEWDNKYAMVKFALLTEKELKKSWRYHSMTLCAVGV
jgi:hypothetical protein